MVSNATAMSSKIGASCMKTTLSGCKEKVLVYRSNSLRLHKICLNLLWGINLQQLLN